jgi:isopenicillin N synthase-like dioxygenase
MMLAGNMVCAVPARTQAEVPMTAALEAVRVSTAILPVIDISGLSSTSLADRQAVGAELRRACLDKGFFYIKNHGVSEELVQHVFAEAAAFFALPPEQKDEVRLIAAMSRCRARRWSPGRRPTSRKAFTSARSTPLTTRASLPACSIMAQTSGRRSGPISGR